MRFFLSLAVVACLTTVANAHFVFVYISDDGAEVRVVFGHTATPDLNSFPARAERTTLTARDANGKETKLATEKGDGNYYRAKLTGKPMVVYGTTAAGVVQRGNNAPVLAWYYPKVIAGDPYAKGLEAGKAIPLDILPVREGEKVRFQVFASGKSAEGVEVTVIPPGKGEEGAVAVKTDKDGLTSGFADRGRYCVAARQTVEKPGEIDGKKYDAVRHTATLVCDVAAPSK